MVRYTNIASLVFTALTASILFNVLRASILFNVLAACILFNDLTASVFYVPIASTIYYFRIYRKSALDITSAPFSQQTLLETIPSPKKKITYTPELRANTCNGLHVQVSLGLVDLSENNKKRHLISSQFFSKIKPDLIVLFF